MGDVGDKYECENCHRVFTRIISDEEALAVECEFFSVEALKDAVIVCDDCYNEIMDWARETGLVT